MSYKATHHSVGTRQEQIGPRQWRTRYEILIWTTDEDKEPCVSGLRDTSREAWLAGQALVQGKARFGRGIRPHW